MKQEIKEKLLTALKSGEYKKGKYTLKDKDGYCCLGVLSDLAINEGICRWDIHNYVVGGDGVCNPSSLTVEISDWSGLDRVGDFKEPIEFVNSRGEVKDAYSLATVNDNTETFDEVIRIIEEKGHLLRDYTL